MSDKPIISAAQYRGVRDLVGPDRAEAMFRDFDRVSQCQHTQTRIIRQEGLLTYANGQQNYVVVEYCLECDRDRIIYEVLSSEEGLPAW